MPARKLVICCNAPLDEIARQQLREATTNHDLRLDCGDCTHADIAFGQPDAGQVLASSRLKWVHITSAGYTRYDTEEMREALQARQVLFTNSSHVYDAPCAQHVLAMILADSRQLLPCYDDQRTTHAWRTKPHREASYLLNGQTVLLLGMGAIARYLVRLLEPFGMEIIAMRKSGKAQPGVTVVSEAELATVLPRADHVVNILPDSPSTRELMNATRFSQMKFGARFYNIGRGRTVEQDALLASLQSGQVGMAYLDVTEPEPLPPGHPLWEAPNCYITPHSGGGHWDEHHRLVEHFLNNLRAYEAAKPLRGCVWENLPATRVE